MQSLFWLLSIIIIILHIFTVFAYPKCVFNENWPNSVKTVWKVSFQCISAVGYYIGNSHQSFYAYALLQNYFQMKILIVYTKNAMRNSCCGRRKNSQKVIERVLLRCIKQYEGLRRYGTKLGTFGSKPVFFFVELQMKPPRRIVRFFRFIFLLELRLFLWGSTVLFLLSLLCIVEMLYFLQTFSFSVELSSKWLDCYYYSVEFRFNDSM